MFRIANPYNTRRWDCKSHLLVLPFLHLMKDISGLTGPQALPFLHLIKDISGRTGAPISTCGNQNSLTSIDLLKVPSITEYPTG